MPRVYFSSPKTARVVGLRPSAKAVVYIAAIAAAFYFPWRLTVFNPDAPVLSLLLYAAELFGLIAIVLHVFMTWQTLEREAPLPPPDVTVDVFIPTYNEPVEMLRRTLLSARNMKYPHETWLLDDGNRAEMAALASELGVHYLARAENTHAKAGNLNNAFAQSHGEFIAIFDADHVPHEDYLVRTLGYFSDSNVAFVQTPQDFYNLDSFQHRKNAATLWSEQSLFFRVIMPGKDYWNAAFFCGSCATARRSSIASIGGFATETVTEDLHTSVRLHKKGYGSVYHPESLAYGIAPDTFEPYESQRVRWGQGAMQVWRLERIVTGVGLTWPQRLCYLASVLTYFDGWQKLFMFLLPSFVLVSGVMPMNSLNWNFIGLFLPWYILSLWACEELGRGYARSWIIEQYNFLRSPGFAFATLTFFLNRRLRFRVTQKGGSARSQNLRRMAPHLAAISFGFLSLGIGVGRFVFAQHMPLRALVLNLIWCAVTLAISVVAVKFALVHVKQERSAYRFRLPIPVAIGGDGDKQQIFAAKDIASGGFSIRVPSSLRLAKGLRLHARLLLPSGVLPVEVEVQRCSPDGDGKAWTDVGLKFQWNGLDGADVLDLYLYGSSAEWRFSGLSEKANTPIQRLGDIFHNREWKAKNQVRVPAMVIPQDFSRSIEMLATVQTEADAIIDFLADTIIKAGEMVTVVLPEGEPQAAQYKVEVVRVDNQLGRRLFRHQLSKVATASSTPKKSKAAA